MHNTINPEKIKEAFEKADPRVVDFILNLEKDDIFTKSLVNLKISDEDAIEIKREVTYIALGLSRKEEFLDNVLDNTVGDEEVISFVVDFISNNVLTSIADIINGNQSRVGGTVSSNNPAPTRSDGKRTSADILLKEIGVHNAPGHEHDADSDSKEFMPSKSDLLAEIEKPTETINKPEFAFPKTKPGTADILKGLADVPYTLADTTKISDGEHSTTIIDPFRKIKEDEKSQSPAAGPETRPELPKSPQVEATIISSNDPALIPETNPTTQIQDNLDKKLNSVTGSTATQSYKIASHDPYREPIEP